MAILLISPRTVDTASISKAMAIQNHTFSQDCFEQLWKSMRSASLGICLSVHPVEQ